MSVIQADRRPAHWPPRPPPRAWSGDCLDVHHADGGLRLAALDGSVARFAEALRAAATWADLRWDGVG
ncbi:hypothetical protein [Micromonospora sp. IBSANI012]|uniref:hypothetical protein n=1 Tax=Micromonospora sp. IBSANI012 TaxID=3457761 RepID=UPI0040582741